VASNNGTDVWVEVEIIENFSELETVVNTGNFVPPASLFGIIWRREL
jgi:hypothetical protein